VSDTDERTLFLPAGVAADADVVHKTGTETVAGAKTFTDLVVADADARIGPATNSLKIGALGDTSGVWVDATLASSNPNVSVNVRAKGPSGLIIAHSPTDVRAALTALGTTVTASSADLPAFIARALQGATPPSGNVVEVQDHTGAVLAAITRFSANFNVTPAFYQCVLTGVKVYAGASDPDGGAPNGSVWLDTTAMVIKTRVAGAWYSPLVPGAWLAPLSFGTGAGNPESLTPATVETPAGRIESPLAGTVRLRGGISSLAAGGGVTQGLTLATLPLALRPAVIRQFSVRTRGVTSTHSTLTIATDGTMALQTTAMSAGSTVFLDGITYHLTS
jgi:hypothetical protein